MKINFTLHKWIFFSIIFSILGFSISIYAQDGTLDSTFGINGVMIYHNGNGGLAGLPDGRFYRLGNYPTYPFFVEVMRSNADGSIDSTFGVNGIARVNFNNATKIESKGISVQSDGKLLVVGVIRHYSQYPLANEKNFLIRFDTNGVVDLNREFGFREMCYPTSVLSQYDGKILVTGSSYYSGDWVPPQPLGNHAYVSRFQSNGSDDYFGSNGTFEMFSNSNCYTCIADNVAVQPSGKVIAFLYSGGLIRLSSNGVFDSTFGNGGFATTNTHQREMVIQPDGKIISAANMSAIIRYTQDGIIDSSFGINGKAGMGSGLYNQPCYYLALQPDGKILAVGSLDSSYTNYNPVCCRFNPNGSLDSTFGINGVLLYKGFSRSLRFYKVYPYADKIIIGVTFDSTPTYIRLKNTGSAFPVHLLTFTAKLKDNNALLNWQVENEQNFDRYQIERSPNGKDFAARGAVKAANKKEYSYTDNVSSELAVVSNQNSQIPTNNSLYYRLKLIDRDGTFTYSPIRQLTINHLQLTIAPNPAHNIVTITGDKLKTITLADNAGRTVLTKVAGNNKSIEIEVSHLPKGFYLLTVTTTGGNTQSEKLVVE